ncbi:WD40 repeat-like protein [Violaceomyces palustris]|uniref:WD40 repeat-like protein n=1 Tax=Violaceomyces palustris TaxID=1673888 RepID=A0ACD0P579_9BASI|nr:WD40 repeat-like protein [Violaceomyces palustris]
MAPIPEEPSQPTKRPKTSPSSPSSSDQPSQSSRAKPVRRLNNNNLFTPFRALGIISNHVPSILQTRFGGKDATKPNVNIITSLGDAWSMWQLDTMKLLFVSNPLPHPITSLATCQNPDGLLAAAGDRIYRFHRGKQVAVYHTTPDPPHNPSASESDSDSDSDSSSSTSSSSSSPSPSPPLASSSTTTKTQLSSLQVFGDSIVSLSSEGDSIFHWSASTHQLLRRIDFQKGFRATSILHPSTYLNKILVASSDGQLQIWNLRTASLVHSFASSKLVKAARGGLGGGSEEQDREGRRRPPPTTASDPRETLITSLTQSPAVDVVAIGYADGKVLLYDIRLDEALFNLQVQGGLSKDSNPISFRTDGRSHHLAIASSTGNISIFDLESPNSGLDGQGKGPRLVHSIREAHDSVIGSVAFVPGQPLLVSSSGDNSFKQWFFEASNAPPRLLKSRSGHSKPPHLLRHFGEEGKEILSAGRDKAVRLISVVRDSRSVELSQGSLEKKSKATGRSLDSLRLPSATSISFSTTRSRDWDDVLSTHTGQGFGHTWFVRDKRMGAKPLPGSISSSSSTSSPQEVTTGCVSACGNFGLIGTSQGLVQVYNMQSLMHRKTLDTRPIVVTKQASSSSSSSKGNSKKEKTWRGKGSPVTGICTDSVNRLCVVSTLDGKLHYFDFSTATALQEAQRFDHGISSIQLQRDSNLLAINCDDLTIRLVDLETRKVVREFGGFRGRVLDLSFSKDSRWLVTSCMDGHIRTFDIPSSRLIDRFKTTSIATSISLSPTLDFLATCHVDSLGVHLWSNRSLFSNHSLRGLDEDELDRIEQEQEGEEDFEVALPTVQGNQAFGGEFERNDVYPDEEEEGGEETRGSPYTSPETLKESDGKTNLVTLSTMPRSRWATLLHLDLIQNRNKPKEKVQRDETKPAPFFLPQVAGTEFRFETEGEGEGGSRRILENQNAERDQVLFQSELGRRLKLCSEKEDFNPFFLYLDTLTTPSLDSEIRSLSTEEDLVLFLLSIRNRLEERKDFESVQSYLSLFLRVHSESLLLLSDNVLPSLLTTHNRESKRLISLLDHCLGVLAFLRDLPLSN